MQKKNDTEEKKETKEEKDNTCFVIMPFSDPDGYDEGHFTIVYEDIIKPAVIDSGYAPIRGDEVKQTNLIHLDLLKKIVEAPMAICDLSSRNPNVMFELGLRQAFDKPVVLIQEKGTETIFDINPFRYIEYCNKLKYRDVVIVQKRIQEAIVETADSYKNGNLVNSIVKLMTISAASSNVNVGKNEAESILMEILSSKISSIEIMFKRLSNELTESKIVRNRNFPVIDYFDRFEHIMKSADSTSIGRTLQRLKELRNDVSLEIDGMPVNKMDSRLIELLREIDQFRAQVRNR